MVIKYANKVHKPFQYTPASASSKPGYLARKFAKLIRKAAKDEKTKVMQ